jgi:hypothetical protein
VTKQRKKQKTSPIGSMSFVERAGLLFGVVGLFADGAVLFTFVTGVSNVTQFIPKSIPTPSALLFFSIISALLIVYGWFIVSWYLVRRTFVLLGQMPVRFNYSLVNRSLRTVTGIGIFLIPLAIAWSVVNLPDSYMKEAGINPTQKTIYVTATPPGSSPPFVPMSVPKPENERIASGRTQYFAICLPFYIVLFGLIIWLPINLLMPIVHVELLLQESAPDIMEQLKEYLEE